MDVGFELLATKVPVDAVGVNANEVIEDALVLLIGNEHDIEPPKLTWPVQVRPVDETADVTVSGALKLTV